MAPKYAKAVDLADDDAKDFFDETVLAASLGPKLLWAYSKSRPEEWKKAIDWAGVKKHRASLTALLDRTGGYMVKQKNLCCQLQAWLCHRGHAWALSDIEKGVWNLRIMLSHLRDFCRAWHDGKKVPKGYEHFVPVLRKFHLSQMHDEDVKDVQLHDEAQQAQDVQLLDKVQQAQGVQSPDKVQLVAMAPAPRQLISVSSNESQLDLEMRLFSGAMPNDEDIPEVGWAEMASLCEKAEATEPPLERMLKRPSGAVLKRPSGAVLKRPSAGSSGDGGAVLSAGSSGDGGAVLKRPSACFSGDGMAKWDPALHPGVKVANLRKRVHSEAYHKTRGKFRKLMDAKKANGIGREAALAAVKQWRERWAEKLAA